MEDPAGPRQSRRIRRAVLVSGAYSDPSIGGLKYGFFFVIGVFGLSMLLVLLLARPQKRVVIVDNQCRLEDSVSLSRGHVPVALAVMPFSSSVHLRIIIEKVHLSTKCKRMVPNAFAPQLITCL